VSEQTKSKKQHEEADKIEDEIAKKTNERLNKAQREFHLREKMKTIRSELAKSNPNENDIEGYRKKVTENPYPEYIKKAVLAEIDRLDGNVSHQDIGYNKAYIE
jgi:ATP-dependent Lon protease